MSPNPPARPSFWRRLFWWRQHRVRFTSAESFAWFIEGLDALQQYNDAVDRPGAERAELSRQLTKAVRLLQQCIDRYPNDQLPAFYLSVASMLQNQDGVARALRDGAWQNAEGVPGADVAGQATPPADDTRALDRAIETAAGLAEKRGDDQVTHLNLAEMYAKRDKPDDLEAALTYLDLVPALKAIERAPAPGVGAFFTIQPEAIAVGIQALMLKRYLLVRHALRAARHPSSRAAEEPADLAVMQPLTEFHAVEQILEAYRERLAPAARIDLEADYWAKRGFLEWETAVVQAFVAPQSTAEAWQVTREPSLSEDDLKPAETSLKRALTLRPSWNPALVNLARVQFSYGDYSTAEATLRGVTGQENGKDGESQFER